MIVNTAYKPHVLETLLFGLHPHEHQNRPYVSLLQYFFIADSFSMPILDLRCETLQTWSRRRAQQD